MSDVRKEQMNIVIVGHVDHGKSTLVGRLLADTGSLPQGKLEAVRRMCALNSKPFEYAFLLDALADEQDQGITIDTARCFFHTERREYIIIDAPGHIEFLKNMISGAARAEAAVLLIDAHEGVRENSRRHGYVLRMLGIQQVVVAVNKMDLVGHSQAAFEAIEAEYRAFLSGIGAVSPRLFIPLSARNGDNVAQRSAQMPWYTGPTVLEALDNFAKAPARQDQPLRFPVQDVYKFTAGGDDRRIVAGRVEAGELKVGDQVLFSPSLKTSTIRSIEGFNVAARDQIGAGWSTGFTLTEELYLTRGEVMSHVQGHPVSASRFRANVIWLGREALVPGRLYKLKLHTAAVPVRVHKLLKVIDASALDGELDKDTVGRHDVADLILETTAPVAFDLSGQVEATGRFVIVDGYEIAGGGIITDVVHDEDTAERAIDRLKHVHWVQSGVGAARARRAAGAAARAGALCGARRGGEAALRAGAGGGALRAGSARDAAGRREHPPGRGAGRDLGGDAPRARAALHRDRRSPFGGGPDRGGDQQRLRAGGPGRGPEGAGGLRSPDHRGRSRRSQRAALRPAHPRRRAPGRAHGRPHRAPARPRRPLIPTSSRSLC